MNLSEGFKLAFSNIRANKLRSFLTILGIVIGVMAVIGMMSVIKALEASMNETLATIGGNSFYIQKTPAVQLGEMDRKYRNRKDITLEQIKALQKFGTSFLYISPEAYTFGKIARYRNHKTNPDIIILGGNEHFLEAGARYLKEGRGFTPEDVEHRRNVCILGMDIVEKLFPFENPLGKEIRIDADRLIVIGVMEPRGKIFGQSQDNFIVLPIGTFLKYYGENRSLGVNVRVQSADMLEKGIDEAIAIMRTVRKVRPGEENDFEIITRDQVMDTLRNLTGFVFIAAVVICSISLLVGGIGIMNIMLVSVTERTREIGIRKAIGARRSDIMGQFITEAIVLCSVGGVVGVIIGALIGIMIGTALNLPPIIPLWSVFLGFGFSIMIGLIFGVYPASKAAKLDPIEALRYE